MRTHLLLASLLLVASLPLAEATSVTVRLRADVVTGAVVFADCDVSVPAGSNVEVVLDQARADGCLLDWSCADFGFDCFVDRIDFVPGQGPFFYAFYVDGAFHDKGIRQTTVRAGGHYHFTLDQWVVFPSPV